MGSCVSKKAARAGAEGNKVAAPFPAAEKESARHALPPVVEADVQEEEVKEVVLSETPVPRPSRPPPPEPIKRSKEQPEADEACSANDTASVESAAKEKAMAKLQKPGAEREAEKRAVSDAPAKKGRTAPEEREKESKPRGGGGGGAGTGRARSPSPSSTHRRQQHPPAPRPRREHPPVVSGIGCRSGRFSPSAARRAAESVVRRTHSARESDMALPSKRSLSAAINGANAGGYGGGGGALRRRDPGQRSGRRSDSPTASRRAPASPSATHRPASPMRKAAKEHGTPERASRPRIRDRGDEHPAALAGLGGERKKVAEGAALGQNPSVAMECFIFI